MLISFSFGKYSTAFQVAENQSAIADLEKNDLQVGMGTADNTGSKIEFSSMEHSMGLTAIVLGTQLTKKTYHLNNDTNYSWTEGSENLTASSDFTDNSNMYKLSNRYFKVYRPETSMTFSTGSTVDNAWTQPISITSKQNMVIAGTAYSSGYINFTLTVGDIYYSDGSLSHNSNINSNKTAVGIVFMTKTSSTDQQHGWKHGYVMGLREGAKQIAWSKSNSLCNTPVVLDINSIINDLDGYTKCQNIKNRSDFSQENYPIIYEALNYKAMNNSKGIVNLTGNCSGWYLPSSGQWAYLSNIVNHLGDYVTWSSTQLGFAWYNANCNTAIVRDRLNSMLMPLEKAGYLTGISMDYFPVVTTPEAESSGKSVWDPHYATSSETDASQFISILFGCTKVGEGSDFDFLLARPECIKNQSLEQLQRMASRVALAF